MKLAVAADELWVTEVPVRKRRRQDGPAVPLGQRQQRAGELGPVATHPVQRHQDSKWLSVRRVAGQVEAVIGQRFGQNGPQPWFDRRLRALVEADMNPAGRDGEQQQR